ncbi:MAG TPA: hypothetical protein VFZ56_02365 [Gemmatimonadaceae bacterium]
MRILWNLVKVAIVLAVAIPLAVIVLATAVGIFGALLGLAIVALRLAIAALIVWGAFRVGKALFGSSRARTRAEESRQLAPVHDRYYEAARRELDRELGHL